MVPTTRNSLSYFSEAAGAMGGPWFDNLVPQGPVMHNGGQSPRAREYRLMPGEWLASLPPDRPCRPDGEGSLKSEGHCVCQEGAFPLREYEMSLRSDE